MPKLSIKRSGHLALTYAAADDNFAILEPAVVDAFTESIPAGLLALLTVKPTVAWTKVMHFWRTFASNYMQCLCSLTGIEEEQPTPAEHSIERWKDNLPPMQGAEHANDETFKTLWHDFAAYMSNQIEASGLSLTDYLAKHLPLWHQLGRVCFHLAENKLDEQHPFAFIATYSDYIADTLKQLPLNRALKNYAGTDNKSSLSQLLSPITLAAKHCPWLNELVESHDIYHPLAFTPNQAHALLSSVPELEQAGLAVKLPNWWKKRSRAVAQVTIGESKQSHFNAKSLLDFDVSLAMDGVKLSADEVEQLMASDSALTLLRGQWVEVDKEKLAQTLAQLEALKSEKGGSLSFIDGMRMLAGTSNALGVADLDETALPWQGIKAGSYLSGILDALNNPEQLPLNKPGRLLKATLRPYQQTGLSWLNHLSQLGLGACLADDMGLGKTIQLIALLLIKKKQDALNAPALLIVPTSLLANWHSELKRFAPSLSVGIVHGSEISSKKMEAIASDPRAYMSANNVIITTYGTFLKQPFLNEQAWSLAILDEAQAIKNPASRQAKSVKQLNAMMRIALTGTPVENRIGDLWSIFDFINPGLLGNASEFKRYVKQIESSETLSYAPLKALTAPYILRRLKTDKSIISDLPDKTELNAWCRLSKQQAVLYQKTVNEMAKMLQQTDTGIKRSGMVLATLGKLKQICNHPAQLSGEPIFSPALSGKFLRLKELCEPIAEAQEKVIIFTQYRSMTDILLQYLTDIFKQPGLVIHGGTSVKNRQAKVANFQNELGAPFFVLSLKAAGTGLNLTAANHVIHFDRWWNPAVENQATDRAYRIGQKKNVLVHKMVTTGTIEEKIDTLINEKKSLSDEVLGGSDEVNISQMSNNELIKLVSLDLSTIDGV